VGPILALIAPSPLVFKEFLCENLFLTFDLDFWKTAPYLVLDRWLEISFPKFNRHEYYTAVSYIIRLGNVRTFKIIWSSKEYMVQFFSEIRVKGQKTFFTQKFIEYQISIRMTTKLFWKYEHCRVEWYMTHPYSIHDDFILEMMSLVTGLSILRLCADIHI
jgi:hypothetical protein